MESQMPQVALDKLSRTREYESSHSIIVLCAFQFCIAGLLIYWHFCCQSQRDSLPKWASNGSRYEHNEHKQHKEQDKLLLDLYTLFSDCRCGKRLACLPSLTVTQQELDLALTNLQTSVLEYSSKYEEAVVNVKISSLRVRSLIRGGGNPEQISQFLTALFDDDSFYELMLNGNTADCCIDLVTDAAFYLGHLMENIHYKVIYHLVNTHHVTIKPKVMCAIATMIMQTDSSCAITTMLRTVDTLLTSNKKIWRIEREVELATIFAYIVLIPKYPEPLRRFSSTQKELIHGIFATLLESPLREIRNLAHISLLVYSNNCNAVY